MTGLEKNGDVVEMACYAPLFAHVKLNQWVPDLIFYSNDSIFGSVNYYVQQLFSVNAGRISLPAELTGIPEGSVFESASVDENGDLILKLVNVTGEEKTMQISVDGAEQFETQAEVTVLCGADAKAANSMENRAVVPVQDTMQAGESFEYTLSPYSLTVIGLPRR